MAEKTAQAGPQAMVLPKSALRLSALASTIQAALSWKLIALLSILSGLYVFVGLLSFTTPKNVFDTPDETAVYVMTRNFAETGRLYLEEDYLEGDEENLLHPRQMATQDGRIASKKSLGQPLLYGAA